MSVAEARPAVAGAPVSELVLSDGRTIAADAVLVGVGVVPETRWLAGSPLAGTAWRSTTARARSSRTSTPPATSTGGQHWELAARLGAAAARSILGLPAAPPRPRASGATSTASASTWSARPGPTSRSTATPEARDFTAVLRRHGVVIGALLVGRPRELPRWRRQLAQPHEERRAA